VARPTVVLLHAFPLDATMWDAIRPAVESAGYEVVAPDLPGTDVELGFDVWAPRVLALVEGPLVPVGSSMGGYLSFELWRQAPDRIAAMALLGTRATPDSSEQRLARDDSIRLLGEAGRQPFWEDLAPKVFADGVDPEVVARAREIVLRQPITGLVATQETIRDRPDSRPTLATIDVPVLVVVGDDDRLTPPADSEAMAEALPRSRLVRVPDAGHLLVLEQPEAVAGELVRFLEEVAQ
jgi:pimeloyl-ACP methyl ester carboxylesterase